MFSPSPSQQAMIENLRIAKKSGKSVKEVTSSSKKQNIEVLRGATSPGPNLNSSRLSSRRFLSSRESKSRSPTQGLDTGRMLMITSESIEEDLDRYDTRGTSVRKIAEAFSGFSVERDGIMLDAFRTRSLDYEDFRMLLKRSVNVTFNELEFQHIIEIFDRDLNGSVDGEEFLTVCKLLARAMKNRKMKRNREREREVAIALKEKEVKDAAERMAVLESAADFIFSNTDEESMLKKMVSAAARVIKQEPGAPPLHGFEPLYLRPKEVFVLIRNAFHVTLTPKELGCLIRLFDYEGRGLLDTTSFLLKFSRWGVEYRDAHRSDQIEKSRAAQKMIHDRSIELVKAREDEIESRVDKCFTNEDKESALLKLRVAAKSYRKGHASSVALDGFSSVTMTPGVFSEMVKRTFGLDLTGRELGAVLSMFCLEDTDLINCQAFLVYFGRTGTEERFNDRSAQLLKNQIKGNYHDDKRAALMAAAHDRNLLKEEILNQHKQEDKDSVIRKLKYAARHYTLGIHGVPGDLDVFKVDKMAPLVFQEKLQKFLGVILTPHEVAALITMFDFDGDKLFIDCHKFSQYFKKIGLGEKELLWKKERERRIEVEEAAVQYNELTKKKFKSMVEKGAVDFTFTPDDIASMTKKMEIGASQYDSTNPQAISLAAFDATYITPGQLKEKLNRTFNIDLNPKELGALIKDRVNSDGNVESSGIVSFVKELGKSVRERRRLKRLAVERAEQQEERERDRLRKEAKIKELADQLLHDANDEKSLMVKLNSAAQAFAIDNASYVTVLSCLKCPSLSPAAFISALYRIFLQKLTPSECGLIMKVVNPWAASHHLVDGVTFLKGFYRLSRLQQAILLGQLDEKELHVDLLSPTYQLDPRLRANLVPVNKSMLSLGSVFDGDESLESQTLTASLHVSPRLQHWSVESVMEESSKLQGFRRKVESVANNSDTDSRVVDDSSIDSLTASGYFEPLKPMIPIMLEGTNPWTDWGIAEAGFFPAYSRPNTTSLSGSRSVGDSKRQTNSDNFSPPRTAPSSTHQPNRAFSPDANSSHQITHGDGIHITDWKQDDINPEIDHREDSRRISLSDIPCISDIRDNRLNSNQTAGIGEGLPEIKPSPSRNIQTRSLFGKASSSNAFKRILKPSLPETFSAIGLARQRARHSKA